MTIPNNIFGHFLTQTEFIIQKIDLNYNNLDSCAIIVSRQSGNNCTVWPDMGVPITLLRHAAIPYRHAESTALCEGAPWPSLAPLIVG